METPKKTYHVTDYDEALYLIGTTMSEMIQKYPSRLVRFEDFDKNQTHIYGWEVSNIIYRHETDYVIDTKLFCDAIKELRDKKLIVASVIEPSYTLSSFFSDQVNTNHIKQEQINEECFNLAKKYPKANFSDLNKEFTVSFNISDKKNLQNLVQSLQTEFSSIGPFNSSIEEKEDNNTTVVNTKNEIDLYITLSGELYREPKEEYCYPIEENSNRHKIILCLNNKEEFCKTEEIAIRIGKKDNSKERQAVRKTIADIRKQVKKLLEIDFITYKRGSGYKLNYKITLDS